MRGVSPVRVALIDVPRVWAQCVETCSVDLGHACCYVLHCCSEVGFMSLPHGLNGNSNLNVIARIMDVLGKLLHFGLVREIPPI